MNSVFLCHSSIDKSFARKLAESFKKMGVKAWIDEAEIKIGDSLLVTISNAIDKTDFFIVLLSPSSILSNWVQKELQMAMIKEIQEGRNRVLPIIVDKLTQNQVPLFLRDKLYADFTLSFEPPFEKLLAAIGFAELTIRFRDRLCKLVSEDDDERIEAARNIGCFNDPQIFDLINTQLKIESNPVVRHWLAVCLGNIGGQRALRFLKEYLVKETDLFAREGILSGLKNLSSHYKVV